MSACVAASTSPRTTRTSTAAVHALARPLRVRDGGDSAGRGARPANGRATTSTCTAGTVEDMYERAEFAKRTRHADHHARLPDRRVHRATRAGELVPRNGMLLHVHRAHARRDSTATRSTASISACWPRHSGSVRRRPSALRHGGGQARGRPAGHPRLDRPLREPSVPENRSRGIFFDQDFGHPCRECSRWPPAESTSGTCPRWSPSSATTRCCSSAAARSAIPWGNAAGAPRQPGRARGLRRRPETRAAHLERDGAEVLREAAEHSPELDAALQTWGDVRFEFDVVDKIANA